MSLMTTKARLTGLAVLAASTMLSGVAFAETVITGVMHSGLRVLDPVITTAHITRDHAYMIYDTFLAQDSKFQPRPQMADWKISDDKQTYTFTLRDGLKFHDGAPVTAEDVIASLQRWSKKDGGGQLIMDRTASLTASDAKTIVWKLKEPFPPMLATLSKQSSLPTFIMPKRVAESTVDKSITDYVGSGPFKFIEAEFKPGVSVTYAKNPDYKPRSEPADNMAGGKVVKVDKVKWVVMPDVMTAVNALTSGEIDYIEQIQLDMLPILKADPHVKVETRDDLGYQTIARFNWKWPPFDNKKARQAALKAISQGPILQAMIGNPDYYKVCGAVLGCGSLYGSEAGAQSLVKGDGMAEAKKLLKESGYDGTPIVLMQPTDVVALSTQPVVVAQQLREAGFKVDMQPMDWQTLVTRRATQKKPSDGGWNMFVTNWIVPEIDTPLINVMLSGRGDQAWFGWPTDAGVEKLKLDFIAATDDAARKAVGEKVQAHNLEEVLLVQLGQYLAPQARRDTIVNMLNAPVPVFWNVEKK